MPSKPPAINITTSNIKYISVETIAGEHPINGVGSGDSNPFLLLGNNSFNVLYDKAAGSPSKRAGGYIQSVPVVGCPDPFLPADRYPASPGSYEDMEIPAGVIPYSRDPFLSADRVQSRHIKTNYGDDVKSIEFTIARFKEYLRKREDWFIKIHGTAKLTQTEFTFNKTDVHRWKDGYLKKRLARLYKLRDWFDKQPSQEVTMVTLTVPHNENIWGKKVNVDHDPFQAWRNLKQGWTRLYQCRPGLFRDKEFVIFYEPHKSGYPHAHLMVFGKFIDEEIIHIKELWADMTGADALTGVDIKPGVGVRHIIAYLMKYISKTLYHTIDSWTPGEWLFNAIAHEERYRLFGSSNNLAEVMRLVTDPDDSVECLDVSLGGLKPRSDDDRMPMSRVWTNPKVKLNHPMLRQFTPIPISDRVAVWKLKNNIVNSPAEITFQKKYKAWLKRGGVDRWRDDKIAGLVLEYETAL